MNAGQGQPKNLALGPSLGTSGYATAAELFASLWESLSDVLGTAATAVLLRRALLRAAHRQAELRDLVISREHFLYDYRLPDSWQRLPADGAIGALSELVAELQPLLKEMTGEVVVRRLAHVAALRRLGISPEEETDP